MRIFVSIPEPPVEEQERVNNETRALLRKIGAVFPEKLWTVGCPQIHLNDLLADPKAEFDFAPFRGRLVIGAGVGFLSNDVSPFPHGPVRLTLVRWGKQPDQCGYIETHSMLSATSIVSYQRVYVGRDVVFGPSVVIMDGDGHPPDRTLPDTPENKKFAPVVIEDHAWIGFGALILKGVTVGHHAVVAANAVVTKSVPPHCVVAGNPAKIIKDFTEDVKRRQAAKPAVL
jgi:hypothetical protein